MKINVEFDLTPDEFRQAMGLPDVQGLQEEVINTILEKMRNSEEGYDAFSLLQPFLNTGMQTMESVQKSFLDSLFSMTTKD
ncbi:MAG: hypothetical protein ACI8SR_001187 [Oceanicoccus sp.]|jgi:hypothetical protein